MLSKCLIAITPSPYGDSHNSALRLELPPPFGLVPL